MRSARTAPVSVLRHRMSASPSRIEIARALDFPFEAELADGRSRLVLPVLKEVGPHRSGNAITPENVSVSIAVKVAGALPAQCGQPFQIGEGLAGLACSCSVGDTSPSTQA
jgi:hypothetical protein